MEEHKAPEHLKKCFAKLELFKDDLKSLAVNRPTDKPVQNLFKFLDTIINFEEENKCDI